MKNRMGIIRTRYFTDDIDAPEEIATLYHHYERDEVGNHTTLYFETVVRYKSKIRTREKHDTVSFEESAVKYCRIIRSRSMLWHPFAVVIHKLEMRSEEP